MIPMKTYIEITVLRKCAKARVKIRRRVVLVRKAEGQ
jgi:hypothetical protein